MSVQQTHSVIDRVREFHQQVGDYYERLANATQKIRVRLLLQYMSDHERRLADALTDYEDSAPEAILNTWLQNCEGEGQLDAVRHQLREARVDPSLDADAVVEMGIKFSNLLLAVYRDLAETAEPDAVRDVFQNLVSMEENAQHRFACDAGRFNDL